MTSSKRASIQANIRAALPATVPVLTSYVPLGAAFGVLLASQGYGAGWAAFMSVAVFAGSMQFAGVGLLTSPFDPVSAALLTLMINARHLFYGLAMLERWRDRDSTKPYRVFALTDESFSLYIAHPDPPDGVEPRAFEFWIALLNQCYWVAGSVAGAVIGTAMQSNPRFDPAGIDFSMTALFLVIFLDQWRGGKGRSAALVGLGSALLCLLAFGESWFLIAAMVMIVGVLALLRPAISKRDSERNGESCDA
ncbi:MAG: AzlC family ABC transporter permease [Oscillospiraceae bacterium]|jgi:4-azaleucine resistance transporter AzlC|nr:AzlC family ABC transporter permease [Oscillospiraceae bacterium]